MKSEVTRRGELLRSEDECAVGRIFRMIQRGGQVEKLRIRFSRHHRVPTETEPRYLQRFSVIGTLSIYILIQILDFNVCRFLSLKTGALERH